MKYLMLLLAFILFLQGCSIVRQYHYDGTNKFNIGSSDISVYTWLLGQNQLILNSDSVNVQIFTDIYFLEGICDSLIVDEILYLSDNGSTLGQSSLIRTFETHKPLRNNSPAIQYYNIYNLMLEGKRHLLLKIPASVRKMTIILKLRFLKDGKISEQYLVEVLAKFKRIITAVPWFQGY